MALPLTLPAYILNATATVNTTIVSNYTTAQVDFQNSGTSIYSLTLVQASPTATLPANLELGTYTIISGTLTMQLPSSIQNGTITLKGSFTDVNNPEPTDINAVIATWSLNQ
ncbi:MAG: hypothetical protein ACJASQ_003100 [Crocinitomicaceae bacterium]|jgi:hypothetical protein